MTFFFTFMFVFLVFWRPQEWLVPQLYGMPLLDAVVACAVAAFLIEVNENKIRVPKGPVPFLILGLFVAALMSHIAHTYWEGMMWTLKEVWKICFFVLLLFVVLDKPSRLRWIARLFVIMACTMAVHALLQKHRGYGFAYQRAMYVPPWGDRAVQYRSMFFGIFEDPNDLAQILAASIPFSFIMWRRRNLLALLAGAGVTALLLAGIHATHSRGGYVAVAAVAGCVVVLWLPTRWTMVLLGLGAMVALALTSFSGDYLDASAHDRVVFWGEANWAFKSSPVNMIFGLGRGMFPDYVSGDRAAHNAFVLCYTELGLFGYWFWFGTLILGILGCWRTRMALRTTRRKSVTHRWLFQCAGASIAAMGGFAASSYFLTRAFVYPMFFLFAILNAVPIVTQRELPTGHPPLVQKHRDLYFWGTILSFGSFWYIYMSILLLNRAWGQ